MQRFSQYVVGGAVRDRLLGLPVQDRDWVVVGATPDDLLALGYQPVGKDFPVFLHPQTHEEYALARTERKTGHGYKGFTFYTTPEVTLEQDLARRDLTINAMAETADGQIIDPYGGQRDLAARVMRHVGPAFVEDPLRILRVARFAARFSDFSVAPETLALMRDMVAAGELAYLVPERVWQELSRGLLTDRPSRMIEVLRACGALAKVLPELDALFGIPQSADEPADVDVGEHQLRLLDQTARCRAALPVRFAALLHKLGKADSPREFWPNHMDHELRGTPLVENLCARLKVPNDCRDLALLVVRECDKVHRAVDMRAGAITQLLERVDVLRRPERFEQLLTVCTCDFFAYPGHAEREYPKAARLRRAAAAFVQVDAGAIAQQQTNPAEIPQRILEARAAAVAEALRSEVWEREES